MNAYARLLALADEKNPKQRDVLYRKYCHGWLIGDEAYRKEVMESRAEGVVVRGSHAGEDVRAINERRWQEELVAQLAYYGKSQKDINETGKAVDWKVSIARHMRTHTRATNPWLAEHLAMGHSSRVSNLIYEHA